MQSSGRFVASPYVQNVKFNVYCALKEFAEERAKAYERTRKAEEDLAAEREKGAERLRAIQKVLDASQTAREAKEREMEVLTVVIQNICSWCDEDKKALAFKDEETLASFSREYDGHLFRDKNGTFRAANAGMRPGLNSLAREWVYRRSRVRAVSEVPGREKEETGQ